jgi:hypothetical protein
MPYISNLVLPFKTNKKTGCSAEQPVFLYIYPLAKLCLQSKTLVSNISTQKQQVPIFNRDFFFIVRLSLRRGRIGLRSNDDLNCVYYSPYRYYASLATIPSSVDHWDWSR